MKKTTKLLSVLLCLAMLISAMPCVSFAAEPFSASDDFSTTTTESIPHWVAATGWYHNNTFKDVTHSSFEVADEMLHIKKKATESGSGTMYYKAQGTTLNSGIITISADIKIEGGGAIPASVYAGTLIGSGPKMIAGTLGTQLKVDNWRSGQGQVLSESLNDGNWYTIKAVFNYSTGKMYVSYIPQGQTTGVTSTEIDFDTATPINYVCFQPAFTQLENATHADKSDIDFYIDNFSIVQEFAPEVSDSSVADGANNVYLNDTFTLYFTKDIDAESAKNIALTSEAGAVAATVTADGSKVTIDPVSALEPLANYTIIVPDTVKSTENVAVTAKTITFTTGRIAEAEGYFVNFENLSAEETASVGTIMGTINEKMPEWRTGYAVNTSQWIRYAGTSGYAESTNSKRWGQQATNEYILDGVSNKVFVEDGKMKMYRNFVVPSGQKDANGNDITVSDNRAFRVFVVKDADNKDSAGSITSGGVRIKFDLNMDNDFTGLYWTKLIELDGLFTMGVNGKTLYFNGKDDAAWNSTSLRTDFSTGLHTFDFMLNLDKGTVDVTIDDVSYGSKNMDGNTFVALQINHSAAQTTDTTLLNMSLDNISIEPVDAPCVLNTSISGFEAAITIDFNQLMSVPDGTIAVADASGNAIDCTAALADNGYQYIIAPVTGTLAAGTYTVTLPPQTAENGLETETTTVTYTRQSSNSELLEVTDCDVYGALSANSAVKVVAEFKNLSASAQTPWVGVVLYDKDGNIKKIACGEKSVEVAGTASSEVTFITPDDIGEGAYLRVFAWDASSSIRPVCHDIRYPAAQ